MSNLIGVHNEVAGECIYPCHIEAAINFFLIILYLISAKRHCQFVITVNCEYLTNNYSLHT